MPQNLFPITREYIDNVYLNKDTGLPINISKDLMSELNKKARKKIRFNQKGLRFGLSDTIKIYNTLICDIKKQNAENANYSTNPIQAPKSKKLE